MTYYTIVVTGYTNADPESVADAVRDALLGADFAVVPCGWAPDPDTIADHTEGPDGEPLPIGSNRVIDLS